MINKIIDHAALSPNLTYEQLRNQCEIAKKYKVASICVNSSYVSMAKLYLQDSKVKVCSVIGFPFGASNSSSKREEIEYGYYGGADEFDIVMNIGDFLSGDYSKVSTEIDTLVYGIKSFKKISKIIIEIGYLVEPKLIHNACELVKKSGANFVKTSTGWCPNDKNIDKKELIDILLEYSGDNLGVKISGGVSTYEDALFYYNKGCKRIGTSKTEEILKDEHN